MQAWSRSFSRAKRFLAHHQPRIALEEFRKALSDCPVENKRELAKILFYLGVSLRKVGLPSAALKCWVTARNVGKRSVSSRMAGRLRSWSVARKLDKHHPSTKFLRRFSNCYGMVKQESEELDDWNAFYAVQLKKYLQSKRSRKIGSQGEKDMIWDLIFEYWQGIQHSGVLAGKSNADKLSLFSDIEIIFPYFGAPEEKSEEIIQVDFVKKTRPKLEDPCPCRSGLPYVKCCGRIPGDEELLYGLF